MKLYDSIEYVKPTYKYLDRDNNYVPINLKPLARATEMSDMQRLTPGMMQAHPLGVVAMGVMTSRGNFQVWDPLAYAAVTKFTIVKQAKFAEIGGVVTKPSARASGLGYYTVETVLEQAGDPAFIADNDIVGYMAKCNKLSSGLFEKLGFEADETEDDKQIMVKRF